MYSRITKCQINSIRHITISRAFLRESQAPRYIHSPASELRLHPGVSRSYVILTTFRLVPNFSSLKELRIRPCASPNLTSPRTVFLLRLVLALIFVSRKESRPRLCTPLNPVSLKTAHSLHLALASRCHKEYKPCLYINQRPNLARTVLLLRPVLAPALGSHKGPKRSQTLLPNRFRYTTIG